MAPEGPLLFSRRACFGYRWSGCRSRSHIHHFSRTRVVQLLPRLFLNRVRIGRLQGFDLLSIVVVFLLQSVDLFLQSLVLGFFLPVNHHAVGAEHYMRKQPHRKHRDRTRRQPASQSIEQGERRTQSRHRPVCPGFGLRSPLHQRPQAIFRPWQNPNFGQAAYSKIHGLVRDKEIPKDSSPVVQWTSLPLWRQAEVSSAEGEGINFDKSVPIINPHCHPGGPRSWWAEGSMQLALRRVHGLSQGPSPAAATLPKNANLSRRLISHD
jgi:hypothetical protein